MGELLKNIFALREEINNLTEIGNQNSFEYVELAIKIADTDENISNMCSKHSNLERVYRDSRFRKSLIFTAPIGGIISTAFFAYCLVNAWSVLTFSNIILAIIGTPTFGGFIAYIISSFLIDSKKFNEFLIRKYSDIKTLNNKLNNLTNMIRISRNNLVKMKNKKDLLIKTIMENEEQIENKKVQLDKLEEDYFNNIKNNPITKGTTYNVSANCKKRTRTIGNTLN